MYVVIIIFNIYKSTFSFTLRCRKRRRQPANFIVSSESTKYSIAHSIDDIVDGLLQNGSFRVVFVFFDDW